jgi:hypothetical protein
MRYGLILIGSLLSLLILIPNINLYQPAFSLKQDTISPAILNQLRYLDHVIANGGAMRMQALFPEGAFLLYSLHTISWIQVAHRVKNDRQLFAQVVHTIEQGLADMENEIRNFSQVATLPAPGGVFFGGWLNWARGTYLALGLTDSSAKSIESLFKNDCGRIAAAYESSSTPYLESYESMAWPSDNVVAVACLRMHDFLYGATYSAVIKKWVDDVKQRLDGKTGMFPYQVDDLTGDCIEGAQANTQAVILYFLAELDPDFAAQQYRLYCNNFPADILGLHFIRHYPKGDKGIGNIDSGPVVFGIGSAATMVGQAPMRMFNDIERASRVDHSIDALGFPITWGNKTRYAFGLMPIADAFLVWSRLARVYTQKLPVIKEEKQHAFWRLKFHGFSAFALLAIWGVIFFIIIKHGPARRMMPE